MDGFRDRFSRLERGGAPRGMERDYNEYGDRDYNDRGYDRDYNDRGYNDYADRGRRPEMAPQRPEVNMSQIEDIVDNSNSRQLKIMQNCVADAKDDLTASNKEIAKAVDAVVEKITAANTNSGNDSSEVIMKAKEEIMQAVLNNSEVLNMLKCSLIKEDAEAAEAEVPSDQELTKALVEELFSNLEDHVHKENVKCYRNVQAALESQDRSEASGGNGSLTLVTIFSILSVALTVVNIALLVFYMWFF